MNAVEIEEAISQLAEQPFDAAEFPYLFLEAFGNKPTTIKKLRAGASNSSDVGGVLQRSAGGPHGPLRPTGGLFRRLCPAALPAGAQPVPVRRPLAPASGEAAEDAEKA